MEGKFDTMISTGRFLFRDSKIMVVFSRLAACLALSSSFCVTAMSEGANTLRTEVSGVPWDAAALENAEKVIYGTDDRIDVYAETSSARKAWAASTCAIVDASDLVAQTAFSYDLTTYAYLYYGKPACSGEPFGSQPTAPFCTAFMVGEDLIATAGHCVNESDLSSVRFLFGFEMTDATTPVLTFQRNQVYTGIEIVHHGGTGDFDHAIVRVDRAITAPGATALPIRRSGTVAHGDRVGVIGHPWGLPKKIAFGTTTVVRDISAEGYFTANLDTYGGNSGSPVFNALSGIVEGILVRGAQDFISEPGCFRSNKLDDDEGTGEEVTRSTVFAAYVPEQPAEGEGESEEGEFFEGEQHEGEPSNEGEDVVYEGEYVEGEGEEEWAIIPNILNLTTETARTILEAKGFVLGTIAERNDAMVEAGRILLQNPEAGTSALPGTAVDVTVSLGPKFAVVPNLTGKSQLEAEAALASAGLLLGDVTEAYHPTVAAGLVISQQPTAGSGVNRGTEVAITLSMGPEPVIEGEGEDEGEGEAEGEEEQPQGCLRRLIDPESTVKTIQQIISDWLVVGVALLVLGTLPHKR